MVITVFTVHYSITKKLIIKETRRKLPYVVKALPAIYSCIILLSLCCIHAGIMQLSQILSLH